MKFIKDYKEGDRVFDIYLCKHKQSAVTKNGKPYETVILQDKTGTVIYVGKAKKLKNRVNQYFFRSAKRTFP